MSDEASSSRIIPPGLSRRNKFNAKFPPNRIKKIIQMDEDIGKMAAPVPVLIGRSVELFAEDLLKKSLTVANSKQAKTLTPQHMKDAILATPIYGFLREVLAKVPELNLPPPQPHRVDGMSASHNGNALGTDGGQMNGKARSKKKMSVDATASASFDERASKKPRKSRTKPAKMSGGRRRATLPAELSEDEDDLIDDLGDDEEFQTRVPSTAAMPLASADPSSSRFEFFKNISPDHSSTVVIKPALSFSKKKIEVDVTRNDPKCYGQCPSMNSHSVALPCISSVSGEEGNKSAKQELPATSDCRTETG